MPRHALCNEFAKHLRTPDLGLAIKALSMFPDGVDRLIGLYARSRGRLVVCTGNGFCVFGLDDETWTFWKARWPRRQAWCHHAVHPKMPGFVYGFYYCGKTSKIASERLDLLQGRVVDVPYSQLKSPYVTSLYTIPDPEPSLENKRLPFFVKQDWNSISTIPATFDLGLAREDSFFRVGWPIRTFWGDAQGIFRVLPGHPWIEQYHKHFLRVKDEIWAFGGKQQLVLTLPISSLSSSSSASSNNSESSESFDESSESAESLEPRPKTKWPIGARMNFMHPSRGMIEIALEETGDVYVFSRAGSETFDSLTRTWRVIPSSGLVEMCPDLTGSTQIFHVH